MEINKKTVDVAVAVLRFVNGEQDKLLLATRHAHQHQGGKLEFVGGKIEQGESAKAALIREVQEELGLDISGNIITKMGRITHDYGDKIVRLSVHQVLLTLTQFIDFKDKNVGLDGQKIAFFDKNAVLDKNDDFPAANAPILIWLRLPDVLTISHELGFFKDKTDWLDCYKNLPKNRTLILRTQADKRANHELMRELKESRQDLQFVVSWQDLQGFDGRILAGRLSQNELMACDVRALDLPDLPMIVSCHDKKSIQKANELAKAHAVMAVLLSPVLPTKTHPDSPHLGWNEFAKLALLADVPVIALGGLSPDALSLAQEQGAIAVAGIREFL